MPEKSGELLQYQFKLVHARKTGDRRGVAWFLRCAASYRRLDMARQHDPDCELRSTKLVNG